MPSLARLIASGCGCGFAPIAPGTAASAVALLLGAWLLHSVPILFPAIVLATTLIGLWAVHAVGIEGDPRWVVIDEVAGQWLALCGIGHVSWRGLLAAFLLFRLLDVVKPGPVGWADRQRGSTAIMADDLIAGGIVAGVLWAFRSHWPVLLS